MISIPIRIDTSELLVIFKRDSSKQQMWLRFVPLSVVWIHLFRTSFVDMSIHIYANKFVQQKLGLGQMDKIYRCMKQDTHTTPERKQNRNCRDYNLVTILFLRLLPFVTVRAEFKRVFLTFFFHKTGNASIRGSPAIEVTIWPIDVSVNLILESKKRLMLS